VFAVHRIVLRQFWLWDDPQLLFGVIRYRLIDFFISPSIWQRESSTSFTPALLTAYKLDLRSAGLDPHTFYVHHLAIFTVAILAVYAYTRLFTTELTAAISAAAVALSPPAYTVAALLMDRHYVAGLVFALAALIAFHFSRPFLGSTLYLIAALEKEVFVPLPLIVLVQDIVARRPRRVVIPNLITSGAITTIYIVWRIIMLGSFGGYDQGRNAVEIAQLPNEVWQMVTGFDTPAALVTIALVAAVVLVLALLRAPIPALLVFCSTAFAALLPLVTLRVLDERFVFVATVAMLICAAAAAGRSGPSTLPFIAFAAFAALVVVGGFRERITARTNFARMEAQGRYLWSAPQDAKPLLTVPNGWYVEGIRWLRRYAKHEEAPHAVASVPGVFMARIPPASLMLLDRSPEVLAASYAEVERTYDPSLPLDVSIARQGHTLRWSFAPAGQWYYVSLPSYELIELDQTGWTRFPVHLRPPSYIETPAAANFRVIRRVGARWNYSRELPWPRDGESYTWRSRIDSGSIPTFPHHSR
jgi:hypothetical protein